MLVGIILVFVLGYAAIAFEHSLKINKSATALLTGAACWSLYALGASTLVPAELIPPEFLGRNDPAIEFLVDEQLLRLTGETAGILFFLMGAMTIVELVDANEGFSLITRAIRSKSKVRLLWLIGLLTFFFSSVLDNLTTTIIMISLLRKLLSDRRDRLIFAGMVVVAANAGGAWTVIGDVTTTMLWIKDKISTIPVMKALFFPSLACLIVPLAGMSLLLHGNVQAAQNANDEHARTISDRTKALFLFLGLGGLLFVPIFKAVTHLPPYVGMIFALSAIWVVSELIRANAEEPDETSTGLLQALQRIDLSSVLFFLGILLAVGCLAATGVLQGLALQLDRWITNKDLVAVVIGFVSSVVDNVPLVAAGIDMYDDPTDSRFWMLLSYCAGTGGSCLIIGSAAGVAAMGLEKIDFIWYLKNITLWAVLGYLAGVAVFLLQSAALGT